MQNITKSNMDKIQLLRDLLQQYSLDGYIIPSTDEWQNEYSPSHKRRLEYITGFSGSNGILIITIKSLILYTDSRYLAQAKVELSEHYTTLDMYKKDNCSWMKICEGGIIGYDPMILTGDEVEYYEKLGKEYNFKLQSIDENLVDLLVVDNEVKIVEISNDDASVLCKKIIDALPQYFSIQQVNEMYINGVRDRKNFAAKIDDKYCGMISIEYNYKANANIYLLGILPDMQGIKIGTKLINYIENLVIKNGIKTLTVETVSLNEGDENYIKTYNFYQKSGFTELFTIKPSGCNYEMAYMVKNNLSSGYYKSGVNSNIVILSDKIAGESSNEKIKRVINFLPERCDFLILTSPESISWLLNIRGNDIVYNTSVLSYAVVSRNEIILFANISSLNILNDDRTITQIDNYNLNNNLVIKDFHINHKSLDEFKRFILDNKHRIFAFDKNKSSVWLSQNLTNILDIADPTVKMRAIKNQSELEGIKLAHLYDGIAICRFWFWLYFSLKSGDQITEMSAAEKLNQFRKMNKFFLYESFSTISAYGSNGAIVHYNPKKNSSKTIPSQGCDYIYLLDSGGQYTTAGTTDITRIFDIGKIFGVNKYEHKKAYTLVLKGHINLARAIFPPNTTGGQLDSLARYDLWQNGLSYGHGTGHGVGHFLSVHEGLHAISGRNNISLEENMILSIEPGYYKEGSFGMRIENLYIVKKSAKFEGFLQFELLTMVPIETSLIDFKLLSEDEISWLKLHNQLTIEKVKDQLTSTEVEFLVNNSKIKS